MHKFNKDTVLYASEIGLPAFFLGSIIFNNFPCKTFSVSEDHPIPKGIYTSLEFMNLEFGN